MLWLYLVEQLCLLRCPSIIVCSLGVGCIVQCLRKWGTELSSQTRGSTAFNKPRTKYNYCSVSTQADWRKAMQWQCTAMRMPAARKVQKKHLSCLQGLMFELRSKDHR